MVKNSLRTTHGESREDRRHGAPEGDKVMRMSAQSAKIEAGSAGKLYVEELRQTMVGKNLSTTDAAKIVVFQVGDDGKPMMIKAV